jgi:DNA polymerase I
MLTKQKHILLKNHKKHMKKYFIIDSYGFVFRAFHVQPPLSSPSGEPVGAVYGFFSMLLKLLTDHKPEHIIAVFDSGGKNFRHEIYPEYKSHRPEVDESLIKQFPLVREVTKILNITSIEKKGFEADDIIASLAKQISNDGDEVVVVSADKDLAQLMNDKIKVYDPVKARYLDEEYILEKFGVKPCYIRDFLAIVGDKSDNIPGVPGFGPKTAADLINKFGNLHNIIEHKSEIGTTKKVQTFAENIENALLSYRLAELKSDIDLEFDIDSAKWKNPDAKSLEEFISYYGFKSLNARSMKIAATAQVSIFSNSSQTLMFGDQEKNTLYNDINEFKKLVRSKFYISLLKDSDCYYASCESFIIRLDELSSIRDILTSESIEIILFNIKNYRNLDFEINSYQDLSIMSYILSSGMKQLELPDLFVKFMQIPVIRNIDIAKEMRQLFIIIEKKLFEQKVMFIYSIDLQLSKILNKIEKTGVLIDKNLLNNLSKEFEESIKKLEKEIFSISGKEFNIASPKQLSQVLFEDLQLPSGKKGKTGALSTGADILENLSQEGYEIADKLLKWRHFSKLKNTYTDALPKLISEKTGRIHTTFLQTSTATGRLSSHEPNLQNIPVRSEEGAKIRSSIISPDGYKLISADYSQVELRILAHIANIKELKDAFAEGKDIHSKTASQIFGMHIDKVDKETRRKAKAINFGIIYGISSYGLAKQLSISNQDAKNYIDLYFKTYPGIKDYMDKTIEFATKNGYVKNYLGRKCYVPLINSSNYNERNFAQRAAINAPIQGSAADIAKIAMINLNKYLSENNYKTKMILQVHDEIIFESPEDEIEKLLPKIKFIMETINGFENLLKVDIEVADKWS